MNGLEDLMQLATVDIVEHDVQMLTEMNVRERMCPYYVMSYIKEGRAVLKIGDEKYDAGPGSIILIPANQKHDHYKIDKDVTHFLWWHFYFNIAHVIDIMRFLQLPILSTLKNKNVFERTFLQYCEVNAATSTLPNLLRRKSMAIEVLAIILEELITDNPTTDGTLVPHPFMEIFNLVSNPSPNEITLKTLSEQYHLNPNYISNRFKEFFGISPMVMRREIILERAKLMLRSTNMPIGDIAGQLGYSDIFTFSHFFVKKVGLSPSKYRDSFAIF